MVLGRVEESRGTVWGPRGVLGVSVRVPGVIERIHGDPRKDGGIPKVMVGSQVDRGVTLGVPDPWSCWFWTAPQGSWGGDPEVTQESWGRGRWGHGGGLRGHKGCPRGHSGVRVSMLGVPKVGSQAPGPTISGQSQAGDPGGSWGGVEGSRASIWGSQRSARSHRRGPRPSALPALQTFRLGVLGSSPYSALGVRVKGSRGQCRDLRAVQKDTLGSGWRSRTPGPTGSSQPKDRGPRKGREVQEVRVEVQGGPRPLILPVPGILRVGVQGGSWGGIPHIIQGSG